MDAIDCIEDVVKGRIYHKIRAFVQLRSKYHPPCRVLAVAFSLGYQRLHSTTEEFHTSRVGSDGRIGRMLRDLSVFLAFP